MITAVISGGREIELSLSKAKPRVNAAAEKNMLDVTLLLTAHVKRNHLSGQSLKVRTGTGRRSIFNRVERREDTVIGIVGADLTKARYMRAQEMGATIVPKRSRYLTIPLPAVLTGNGVARFSARQVIDSPQSFGYRSVFFRNKVLFGSIKGRLVPLFALKERVVLKRVGYLADSLREKQAMIMQIMSRALPQAVLP